MNRNFSKFYEFYCKNNYNFGVVYVSEFVSGLIQIS